MRQYVADLTEAFETLHADMVRMLEVGDTVVGVGRVLYKGRGSGLEGDVEAGWVFRFRDGKVIHFHAFSEPQTVLASVGLDT
jgi:ketosteroid isomerase-like protein